MNRNLAEMVRLRISSITSSIALRAWLPIPFLLLAMLALLAPTAEAQVQFGGFPIAIGSSGNPWNGPVGVASDTSGNIYVAQFNGQTVLKIDATTHATSVFLSAACGGGFNGIQEIATDASNNLYVADTYRDQVEVYSIATATCTARYPVYGGFGVAVDGHGDIWVTATGGDKHCADPGGISFRDGPDARDYLWLRFGHRLGVR